MASINYFDTFIAAAPDSAASTGMLPGERATPSVAALTHRMISEHPYEYTSDDVVFAVYADRHGIAEAERNAARDSYFAKPQPCLRASDLGKKYGWGIHCDGEGRVALYGVDSAEYGQFLRGERLTSSGSAVTVKNAMRSSRAKDR